MLLAARPALPAESAVYETFEGQAPGSTYTAMSGSSDSGFDGTGTWTFDTANVIEGAQSGKLAITASSAWRRGFNLRSGYTDKCWFVRTFYYDVLPTTVGTNVIGRFRSGEVTFTTAAELVYNSTSGVLLLRDGQVATAAVGTVVLAAATQYTVLWNIDGKAQRFWLYDNQANLLEQSPDGVYTHGAFSSLDYGAITAPGNTPTIWSDFVGYNTVDRPPIMVAPLQAAMFVAQRLGRRPWLLVVRSKAAKAVTSLPLPVLPPPPPPTVKARRFRPRTTRQVFVPWVPPVPTAPPVPTVKGRRFRPRTRQAPTPWVPQITPPPTPYIPPANKTLRRLLGRVRPKPPQLPPAPVVVTPTPYVPTTGRTFRRLLGRVKSQPRQLPPPPTAVVPNPPLPRQTRSIVRMMQPRRKQPDLGWREIPIVPTPVIPAKTTTVRRLIVGLRRRPRPAPLPFPSPPPAALKTGRRFPLAAIWRRVRRVVSGGVAPPTTAVATSISVATDPHRSSSQPIANIGSNATTTDPHRSIGGTTPAADSKPTVTPTT